jgi:hypothetical protein
MTLLKPNEQDQRKIHAEINQIVNQRFTIATLSVTVFGVILAWLLPSKNIPEPGALVSKYTFLISYLLAAILFLLFLLTHYLTSMLRVMSTYLAETKSSNWEIDWKKYRDNFKYRGYTKPLSMMFLVLGELSLCIPYFLSYIFKLQFGCKFAIISTIFGLTYLVAILGMGFLGWGAKEEEYRNNWKTLNEKKDPD